MLVNKQSSNVVIIVLSIVAIAAVVGIVVVAVSDKPKSRDAPKAVIKAPVVEDTLKTRSQDTEVKNGVFAMESRIQEYVNNNNGKFPMLSSEVAVVNAQAHASKTVHPINKQSFVLVPTDPKDNEILYLSNRKCKADGTYELLEKPRTHILQALLPSGKLYCIDG